MTQYNRIQYNAMHKFVTVLDKYECYNNRSIETLCPDGSNTGAQKGSFINVELKRIVCAEAASVL